MEFTNAQIRDFAGSDEQYEKAKRLVDEQRIVSLDIDDFSSREIIMINATIKDGKNYREVNMSIDKDDVTVRAHLCSCPQHGKDTLSCEHCTAVLIKLNEEHEKKQKETDAHTAVQQHDSYAISLMNAYEEQIIYSYESEAGGTYRACFGDSSANYPGTDTEGGECKALYRKGYCTVS